MSEIVDPELSAESRGFHEGWNEALTRALNAASDAWAKARELRANLRATPEGAALIRQADERSGST